jgi:hypothetical protein
VIAAEAHGGGLVIEAGCAETRSAETRFNLTGKLTLRIESKAQLIQTRVQPITSGYRYSSENGAKRRRWNATPEFGRMLSCAAMMSLPD